MAKKAPKKPEIPPYKPFPQKIEPVIVAPLVEPPKPEYTAEDIQGTLSKIQLALEKATKDMMAIVNWQDKIVFNELKTILMLIENAQSHIGPMVFKR